MDTSYKEGPDGKLRPALPVYWDSILESGLRELCLFAGEDDRHPAVLVDGPLPMPLAARIGAVGEAVAAGQIAVDGTGDIGGLHLPESGLYGSEVEAESGDILPGL